MTKETKRTLLVYMAMIALILIGHITSNLIGIVVFATLGYFWGYITKKDENND